MRKRPTKSQTMTISLKAKDIEDLRKYIEEQSKLVGEDSELNKSFVIRKALRILYEIKKPFDKIKIGDEKNLDID